MQYPKISSQNNIHQSVNIALAVFSVLSCLLIFVVKDNAFFWDTVQLGSLHGTFYFENNFQTFLLPQDMDSGHPPFFGMYIAAWWKIFGRSLAVSHLAMLPFILGTVYILLQIGQYFFQSSKFIIAFIAIMFFDPCWIGQAALISPDVILAFGFFLSLYGILFEKKISLAFGIIFLCMISMRGMMTVAALFSFDLINLFFLQKNKIKIANLFSKSIPYWIGGLLGFSFLIFHYVKTGWIGYHESSPWAPCFNRVDFQGGLRNVGLFIWRVLDFGRVFLVFILAIGFGIAFFQKRKLDKKILQLLSMLFVLLLFLLPSFIIHENLSAHRYLLPILLTINVLAVYSISVFFQKIKIQNILLLIGFLGLSTGNFWIYPKTIAQSWDTTLAHLPYFELREKMIDYLDEQNIPIQEVGSVYPNLQVMDLIDLNGRIDKFSEKNFQQQKYMFYSNVFNDFSDAEILLLEKTWEVKKEFRSRGISVILYSR